MPAKLPQTWFLFLLQISCYLVVLAFPLPPDNDPDEQKCHNDNRYPDKAADSEEGRADMAQPAP